jgi:DNA (cytosine-5)-methyltransferase 1
VRLGSLCSGYGGLEAGISQVLDIEPVWCSEIDKDASKVLAAHDPSVPNLGDLTVLDWHQVEPVDIICAGFPCQPFSYAGKRQGADDERAIFSYTADGISVLRPRLVVLENVPGILTLGGVSVVGTLTGLGYDCRWGIVRASDTGAPHRRARWFCVAEPADAAFLPGPYVRKGATDDGNPAELSCQPRGSNRAVADADDSRLESVRPERGLATATIEPRTTYRFGPYEPAIERWERILGRPAPDPTDDRGLRPEFVEWMMGLDQGYICDLGLSRTAALKMLGNGVVPQQAALAVNLLVEDPRG